MEPTSGPEVSIITPLYNSSAFIENTIRSVLNQTFRNWEYLIVDDCSNDAGPSIVEKFASEDSRMRLIRLDENGGAGIARNRGICEARGRYIAFIDSDDSWLPEKLQVQLNFMMENNAPFSFTDYRKMDEDGKDTGRIVRCPESLTYRRQLKTNFVGCSTAVYDSNRYGKRYFPEIRKRQDYALWLEILKEGEPGRGINRVLTEYTVRSGGLSSNKLELVRHNWIMYRNVLSFGYLRSFWYLCWNIVIKLLVKR